MTERGVEKDLRGHMHRLSVRDIKPAPAQLVDPIACAIPGMNRKPSEMKKSQQQIRISSIQQLGLALRGALGASFPGGPYIQTLSFPLTECQDRTDHIISGDRETEPFGWLEAVALVPRVCTNEHAEMRSTRVSSMQQPFESQMGTVIIIVTFGETHWSPVWRKEPPVDPSMGCADDALGPPRPGLPCRGSGPEITRNSR